MLTLVLFVPACVIFPAFANLDSDGKFISPTLDVRFSVAVVLAQKMAAVSERRPLPALVWRSLAVCMRVSLPCADGASAWHLAVPRSPQPEPPSPPPSPHATAR